MDLKKMFVIEGTEAREKFISKPHTKKYERLIEVKAFTLTQNNLDLEQEMVDEVLPALVHAREYHAQLVRDVQDLNAVNLFSSVLLTQNLHTSPQLEHSMHQ
jgi:hypothetical protein